MAKKILICDDEHGVRESLKLILGEIYELIVVDSPVQCLETLKTAHDDVGVVLLDIKMPQIDGIELLKMIKTDHPELPCIMVTGYKSVETASAAAKLGATGYIVKPFTSEDVLETVKRNYKG